MGVSAKNPTYLLVNTNENENDDAGMLWRELAIVIT
jgi:hypothetical protein